MFNNLDLIQTGLLTVICGPMFAGKTEELIRKINVLKRAGKKVIVFLPQLAERYQKDKIVSHDQRSIKACLISTPKEMQVYLQAVKYDAICFDEVQFFSNQFFKPILELVKKQKIVICGGLEKDNYAQYQGLLAKLLVRADVVLKLSSICAKCNGLATRTQRISKTGEAVNTFKPKILIGSNEHYQARCNRCFVEFIKDEEKTW